VGTESQRKDESNFVGLSKEKERSQWFCRPVWHELGKKCQKGIQYPQGLTGVKKKWKKGGYYEERDGFPTGKNKQGRTR